jgi:hypothetical protein
MTRRRGILVLAGAVVIVGPPVLWVAAPLAMPRAGVAAPLIERAAQAEIWPAELRTEGQPAAPRGAGQPAADLRTEAQPAALRTAPQPSDLGALGAADPLALVRLGRARYAAQVKAYRCMLVKQERLGSKLSEVQEIELRFREEPFAVYMLWQKNADQVRRALHMRGGEYVDKQGEPLARVEPAGAVARLFVKDIFMPIHGADAQKASRRAIDEAGFRATFELLEKFNGVAEQNGVLDLRYGGVGTIDGRPTFVITRNLPYQGPAGPYPDARMVMHLDQEWLLPVAVYSYADADEKELLGSYVFSKIELNPQFGAEAFAF